MFFEHQSNHEIVGGLVGGLTGQIKNNLLYLQYRTLYMELCLMLCVSLHKRGVWGRMNTCICMTEFLCCPPETIPTLLISSACTLCYLSHVRLFATPWTVACQAPLSVGILQARILHLLCLLRWQADSLPLAPPGNCLISYAVCAMLSRFTCVPLFATPWTAAHRLLHPWDSLGKSTGVGCHAILQVISYTPIQSKKFFLKREESPLAKEDGY